MAVTDTRHLTQRAQDALRERGIAMVVSGMRQAAVARALHVREATVSRWMSIHRRGSRVVASKRRGPKSSPRKALKPWQQAMIARLVVHKEPRQLRLPFALWTRQSVAQLIKDRFGITLSRWTVGNYLRVWGFTPQVPAKQAYQRCDATAQAWKDTAFPAIRAEAKKAGASVWFCDETGMRSDDQVGRTWARRGQTPVVRVPGRRFSCNVISAITARGELAFSVFEGTLTVPLFIKFLDRLCDHAKRMVFLIVDGHPVHRAKAVAAWVAANRHRIRMFFLPPYSPDLNPDELLNHDLKANTIRRSPPATIEGLKAQARSHLRRRQRQPQVVARFFREAHVAYAA